MAKNPVQYAEETLGVHSVYDEAKTSLDAFRDAQERRAGMLADLRENRRKQQDREMEKASDIAGKYAELSDTARGKLLKAVIHQDPDSKALREEERQIQRDLDQCEVAIAVNEKRIAVHSSRMQELGGLLQFFAAARSRPSATPQVHESTQEGK